MLRVVELVKRYNERPILRGISFAIQPGEVVALVGANGAGKSTLIRAILGLTAVQGGQIMIGPESDEPGSMEAKRLITYVPEQPMLYTDLTAWEHLRYVAMIHGMEQSRFDQRAEWLLRSLRLWDDRHLDPLQMSKGMKQKVSLAAAILPSPRLLLLDEPFSGLDPLASRHLREMIRTVKGEGTAVLMSTHLLDSAERISDRFLLLFEGHLVGDGEADSLRGLAGLPASAPLDDVFAELCARRLEP